MKIHETRMTIENLCPIVYLFMSFKASSTYKHNLCDKYESFVVNKCKDEVMEISQNSNELCGGAKV